MKNYAHKIEGTDDWCNESEPPKVQQVSPPAEEPTEEPKEQTPVQELFEWIAVNKGWKDAKIARSWIVNKCKIADSRITSEPELVRKEIAQLEGWTI